MYPTVPQPMNENKQNICPECGSTNLIFDHERAEVSCKRCGLVIEESIIDQGAEFRAFDHEQYMKRARVGAPTIHGIADKGLPTDIAYKNKDAKGNNVPERNIYQMHRLRKLNKRMRISRTGERNLALALSELDRKSSLLGIPRPIREDAALIYRNAAKKGLVRGRSIESIVAVSLYISCRRGNIPRTLDEISNTFNITRKKLGKHYRFISRELKIKLKPTSPVDYVPRFATLLGVSDKVQVKAIKIIEEAVNKGLINGKEPTGVSATSLYIASMLLNEKRTQKEISEIAGVTEVTIRNRFKEFSENLDLIVF